jgi:hypothetical protein
MRLSKKQIAEQLELPVGRVRYYAEQFSEYFDGTIEDGKRWELYGESALEVTRIIAEMIGKHSHNEIRNRLNEAGLHPVVEMIEQRRENRENDITTTNDMLNVIETQQTIIRVQRELIEELKNLLEDKNPRN